MLSATIHRDIDKFPELAHPWSSLARIDPNAGLFTSFPWAENWIRHFWDPAWELRLITLRDGDRLVALLPFYLDGSAGVVRMLGTGEPEIREVASEYLDLLVDPEYAAGGTIYGFMADQLDAWCQAPLELLNCLDSSHLLRVSLLSNFTQRQPTGKRFRIKLARPFEQITQDFSRNQRKQAREMLNRFERAEKLSFRELDGVDYQRHWDTLRTLHTRSWNERGRPGAFTDPVFNNFHRSMHDAYPGIRQHFFALEEEGAVVAINHFYQFADDLHFYAAGALRDFGNISPGTLLHLLCIRALAGKTLYYDFMKGALEDSYKGRFCAPDATLYRIRIYPDCWRGRLSLLAALARQFLSRARKRIRA